MHVIFDQMPASSSGQSHHTSEMQEPHQQVNLATVTTAVKIRSGGWLSGGNNINLAKFAVAPVYAWAASNTG